MRRFTQRNGASWAQGNKDFTARNLTYDANGNIKPMLQKGMVSTMSKTIDDLTYTYANNKNNISSKSRGVQDIDSSVIRAVTLGDFIDGNTAIDDYTYDANGNMIADLNKKIASIIYNI